MSPTTTGDRLPPLKTLEETAQFAFQEIAKSITISIDPARSRPDIIEWILSSHTRTERGDGRLFEFSDHFFLVDLLRDMSPQQVVTKGSQIGMSTCMTLKEIWCAKYMGWSSIHTFPTLRMVNKFVPVKVDGIIAANPHLAAMIGKGTGNSVQKKKVGKSWIFWAGCEGDNEGIMDTADVIINDEVDRSNPLTLADFKSRTDASDYGGRWDFSNPRSEGAPITKRWKESCQYHLFFRCSRCGAKFYNAFFNCVDLDNPKKQYICPRCRKPLREEDRRFDPATGYPRWIAKYPSREIKGYWINHMIAPWKTAAEVISDYEQMSEEYFYTFVLAQAPHDPESRIDREMILRNCSSYPPKRDVVLVGIDQGKTFYAVIGNKEGIFALETFDDWTGADEIMRSYDVHTCVVDYLPDTDGAMEFKRRWPGKVLLNLQSREHKPKDIFQIDERQGYLITNKHPMISKVVKEFARGGIKIFMDPQDPRLCGRSEKDYRSYCVQAETLYRTEEHNQRGETRLVWNSTNGMDHWFLATCYWYGARERYLGYEEDPESVQTAGGASLHQEESWFSLEAGLLQEEEVSWLYV